MNHQMQVPPLTKTNKILLILSALVFIFGNVLYVWFHVPVSIFLGLSWEGMVNGKIYQLLTYPFWQVGLFPLVFQSLLLWWTGGELEQQWGSKFYAWFVVSVLLVTGVLFTSLSLLFHTMGIFQGSTLVGMSGLTLALLFAYASMYPERQFSFFMLFPMKAKHFCFLLAAIEVYQILFSSFGSSLWGHLLGGIWGVFLLKFLSWRSRRGPTLSRSQRQADKLRKSFKVISTDDKDKNDGPKYWH